LAGQKKLIAQIVFSFVIFSFVLAPVVASAQNFVIPCLGPVKNADGSVTDCTFNDFMHLIKNVIDFLIILSIPMATIAFAWAGFLILTSGGNSGKIEQGKEIFWKVLIGFIFVLSAWLIVSLITTALLDEERYTNLLGSISSVFIKG
jgi:hypothetical protein